MFTPPLMIMWLRPVGEVEVALLVDPADVAEPAPAARVPHGLRLLGVAVVLEGAVGLEPHLALLADRELVAVVVEDVDGAGHRLADRAGVGEPVLGADVAEAGALAAAVELVDDRAEPVEAVACFTSTGHGAAACTTICRLDRS